MTGFEIATLTAAVVAAAAAVWNTGLPARLRNHLRQRLSVRQERKTQEERVRLFAAQSDLQEIEDRFDELFENYESRSVPPDLQALWGRVFRLASKSPVRHPFRFGSLVIRTSDPAMRIRKGDRSVADVEWMSMATRPVLPMSLITGSMEAVEVVKE